MISAGDIVLFRFPQTNLLAGKLRPALLLKRIGGRFDDWLVCMISTQVHLAIPDLDELIALTDADFAGTGLKRESLIRLSRLAVVDASVFEGKLGSLAPVRLAAIQRRLADWLTEAEAAGDALPFA